MEFPLQANANSQWQFRLPRDYTGSFSKSTESSEACLGHGEECLGCSAIAAKSAVLPTSRLYSFEGTTENRGKWPEW